MQENEYLAKLQNEMLGQVDQEVALEREIEEASSRIAHNMAKSGNKSTFEVNHLVYEVQAAPRAVPSKTGVKHYIIMIIADQMKMKILGKKYIPYTVNAEIDNSLEWEANLKAMIQAWMRHVSGLTDKADFEGDDNGEE